MGQWRGGGDEEGGGEMTMSKGWQGEAVTMTGRWGAGEQQGKPKEHGPRDWAICKFFSHFIFLLLTNLLGTN